MEIVALVVLLAALAGAVRWSRRRPTGPPVVGWASGRRTSGRENRTTPDRHVPEVRDPFAPQRTSGLPKWPPASRHLDGRSDAPTRNLWAAARQGRTTDVAAAVAAGADVRTPDAGGNTVLHLTFAISLGIPGTEDAICRILEWRGDVTMAAAVLNAGHPVLRAYAEDWLTERGYSIVERFARHRPVTWGEG